MNNKPRLGSLVIAFVGTAIVLAIPFQAQAIQVAPSTLSSPQHRNDLEAAPKGYGSLAAERWQGAMSGQWADQNNLALMLAIGKGAPKDVAKALYWMKRAAGNVRASGPTRGAPATTLGWWYLTGEHAPIIPVDDAKALCWNKQGTEQGHPNAIQNLALMYATGLGVERSYDKAATLLAKAVTVFSQEHAWVLEEDDDWATFSRAKVPEEFMELNRQYLREVRAKQLEQYEEPQEDKVVGDKSSSCLVHMSSNHMIRPILASYEPKLETAGDFLQTCPASSDNHSMEELSRFSFCMGVVRGILLADGGKSVCMPSGESLFDAVDVVREWVRKSPGERKTDARRAVMRALGEKYPCRV
jgi:hypothetical protein